MKGDFIKVDEEAEAILTRRINELAHNVGMSRQHKKLVKDLLFHATQEWYHMGYAEGCEDNREMDAEQYNEIYGLTTVVNEDGEPEDRLNRSLGEKSE